MDKYERRTGEWKEGGWSAGWIDIWLDGWMDGSTDFPKDSHLLGTQY